VFGDHKGVAQRLLPPTKDWIAEHLGRRWKLSGSQSQTKRLFDAMVRRIEALPLPSRQTLAADGQQLG